MGIERHHNGYKIRVNNVTQYDVGGCQKRVKDIHKKLMWSRECSAKIYMHSPKHLKGSCFLLSEIISVAHIAPHIFIIETWCLFPHFSDKQ